MVPTLEELAYFLQRQETADLAGSRLGADTTEPRAEQDSGDGFLDGASPLGVVSGLRQDGPRFLYVGRTDLKKGWLEAKAFSVAMLSTSFLIPASTSGMRVSSVVSDVSRSHRGGGLVVQTLGARGRVNARQQALGEGDVLGEVVDDLFELLADLGVLLDLGLELVEQRGVDQGRHILVVAWLGWRLKRRRDFEL